MIIVFYVMFGVELCCECRLGTHLFEGVTHFIVEIFVQCMLYLVIHT